MRPGPMLSPEGLTRLLPMHLWLGPDGGVWSAGATLLKLVPDLRRGVPGCLSDARGDPGADVLARIRDAAGDETRLFLRVDARPELVLRGHAVPADNESVLLNLGFGIDVHRAIVAADLIASDFPPTDLVMEFLFLHEANRAVLAELARFNRQLASARRVALTQAHSDVLTGLSNRRGLELALSALLRPAQDDRFAPAAQDFSLVHLDLDHFKQVNDTHGHKAGDDLLRHVGRELRHVIRKADTAARPGGDEFVLVLRSITCPDLLSQLCDRLIASIRAIGASVAPDLSVSASMGVVIWKQGCTADANTLLALADDALYRSKRAGRGGITLTHCPPVQEARP